MFVLLTDTQYRNMARKERTAARRKVRRAYRKWLSRWGAETLDAVDKVFQEFPDAESVTVRK